MKHVLRQGNNQLIISPPGTGGFTAGAQFKADLNEAKRLIMSI